MLDGQQDRSSSRGRNKCIDGERARKKRTRSEIEGGWVGEGNSGEGEENGWL